ncbi:FAD binding domain-containing protein [soil metagenome]
MPVKSDERFYIAKSQDDAVAALADRGRDGRPLAGATWIMRAPLRHERHDYAYVALSRIAELRRIDILADEISIGACVTHAELALRLADFPDCRALAQAAAHSANPAVREVATIGGNLCASGFAAADLIPALICLDADVELILAANAERMPIERFLQLRTNLDPGFLVRRAILPRSTHSSAHIRLPLRKAGDYPVAIVSLFVSLKSGGVVERARVAVGSVETVARRWERMESALTGHALNPKRAADDARLYSQDFHGRDGIEAPGWYRQKVLPSLVRRAVEQTQMQRA